MSLLKLSSCFCNSLTDVRKLSTLPGQLLLFRFVLLDQGPQRLFQPLLQLGHRLPSLAQKPDHSASQYPGAIAVDSARQYH